MSARTKIVTTIGPASDDKETIKEMLVQGTDVFRLAFAHGTYEHHLMMANNVRNAAQELGRPVGIMQDLQGPKIRIDGGHRDRKVKEGDLVVFLDDPGARQDATSVLIDKKGVFKNVKIKDKIYIEDGKIVTEVIKVIGDKTKRVQAKVLTNGTIKKRKGVNLPDTRLEIDVITKKDQQDLKFGLENIRPDFIAFSFAQSYRDVCKAKELIDGTWAESCRNRPEIEKPDLVLKLEKKGALKDFDKICRMVDVIMLARGDLGVESDWALLPLIQKKVILRAREFSKPVIVATEMLASMEQNPRPTRAEVSDVANAVLDGADAVMTSNETAMGRYPIQAVQVQNRVLETTEEETPRVRKDFVLNDDLDRKISSEISKDKIQALVIKEAKDIQTTKVAASSRPSVPIISISSNSVLANQASLVWGVKSVFIKEELGREELIDKLKNQKFFKAKDKIAMIEGGKVKVVDVKL